MIDIKRIRETQREFQRAVGFPVDTICARERDEVAEKYLFKLIEEVIELRKEFQSVMNPWSKSQKLEDVTRVKEELADVILFLINFINVWKFTDEEIVETIYRVQKLNFEHLKTKKLNILDAEMLKVPDAVMTGNGNMTPKYVFIGQNPGQGLSESCKMVIGLDAPKCTAFGLLFKVLGEKAIKQSYFTNLVKVKTPENETPNENLTNFWFDFLKQELEILSYNNPHMKVIALGNWTFRELHRLKLEPYFINSLPHPAYVLHGGMSEESYRIKTQAFI